METTRREFLKESMAALGFLALPGGWLFASPPSWKPKERVGPDPAKRAFYRAFRDFNPLNDLGSG